MANLLSKNLSRIALERGVKWNDVSLSTGIAPSMISRWLTGAVVPRDSSLQKVADYFGVPLGTITGDSLNDVIDNKLQSEETRRLQRDLISAQREVIDLMKEVESLREQLNQTKERKQ